MPSTYHLLPSFPLPQEMGVNRRPTYYLADHAAVRADSPIHHVADRLFLWLACDRPDECSQQQASAYGGPSPLLAPFSRL